ncbi:TIGR04255 family protein [Mycobacteroides salmoniphilum]|uniref:TIGR04255 family protein n=1 Tax=Mycobacteroides salmoniphilum TaxID=404941 RepID=UPI001064D7DB
MHPEGAVRVTSHHLRYRPDEGRGRADVTSVAHRREYPNPPIAEVICQVAFAEPVQWSAASAGLLFGRIREDYPVEPKTQVAIEAILAGDDGKFQVNRGNQRYVYANKEQNRRLVANENTISVNALPPYENWNSLSKRFQSALSIYQEEFGSFIPATVSLRYINRIVVPGVSVETSEYFNVPVVTTHQPDARVHGFVSRSQSRSPETEIGTTVTFASADGHTVENESAFILDIDLEIPAPPDATAETLGDLASLLHGWENHEFESSIKDKARDLFA